MRFEPHGAPDFVEVAPADHGRIETRRIWCRTALNDYLDFPHVGQVFLIEREAIEKKTGKPSRETALGITSQTPHEASPERVRDINRGHWAIESTHDILDGNDDEDRRRSRTGHGPENITRLRRVAVGILKSFQTASQSIAEMLRTLCFCTRRVFDYLRMTKNSASGPRTTGEQIYRVFQYEMSLNGGAYFQREMSLSDGRSESVMMPGMVIDMDDAKWHTVAQVKTFLAGTSDVTLTVPKAEHDGFIERVLKRFGYAPLSRYDNGVVLRDLEHMTGLSRQQVTRLVQRDRTHGRVVKRRRPPTNGFRRRFTATDTALLAEMDTLHRTLSGPATKKRMERAFLVFGEARFERLAGISVSHLYHVRGGKAYQETRRHWTKTRPTGIPIGPRRAPQPNGAPGSIRIDRVHQGDQDGRKGGSHINAVDAVTQFQLIATCEKISEAYLLPVIRQLLEEFPFVILGFHADKGSEYVNDQVATLLETLRIEFTKSRPRHSNDHALAESKNGAVVRTHLGDAHIPQQCAVRVNAFCAEGLNPYVNFHRPCFFPETITDEKGKERTRYRYAQMMTPYDKLTSLPDAAGHLKPGVTCEHLDATASRMSDHEAAALNTARQRLFQSIAAARHCA